VINDLISGVLETRNYLAKKEMSDTNTEIMNMLATTVIKAKEAVGKGD
jgi:hypothetical protein